MASALEFYYKELTADQRLIMFDVAANGTFKGLLQRVVADKARDILSMTPDANNNQFTLDYFILKLDHDIHRDLLDFLNLVFQQQSALYNTQETTDVSQSND